MELVLFLFVNKETRDALSLNGDMATFVQMMAAPLTHFAKYHDLIKNIWPLTPRSHPDFCLMRSVRAKFAHFTKKTNAAENAAARIAAMEIIFCIDAKKSNAARAAGKK